MADLADKRTGKVFALSLERRRMEIEYDFSLDAGAQVSLDGAIIGEQMVIERVYYKVDTTHTSGGSATVEWGDDVDPNSLIDQTAVASLTAGAVISQVAGADGLVLAVDAIIQVAVATADLTAGKGRLVIEFSQF